MAKASPEEIAKAASKVFQKQLEGKHRHEIFSAFEKAVAEAFRVAADG